MHQIPLETCSYIYLRHVEAIWSIFIFWLVSTAADLQKSEIFRKIEKVLQNHWLVSHLHQISLETCSYTYLRQLEVIWSIFIFWSNSTGADLQKSEIFRKIEKVLQNHWLVSHLHQISLETCFYTYSRVVGSNLVYFCDTWNFGQICYAGEAKSSKF
jgi:hypothetical protein